MPGTDSGSQTVRNTKPGRPPRLEPAIFSSGGIFCIAANSGSTMKGSRMWIVAMIVPNSLLTSASGCSITPALISRLFTMPRRCSRISQA